MKGASLTAGSESFWPAELARDFGADDLRGHFLLDHGARATPAGWRRRELGRWSLSTPSDAPVLDLVDAEGNGIGWLVGALLDLDASSPVRSRLVVPAGLVGDMVALDTWLHAFGGRYACLLVEAEAIHLDAYGAFPVFYATGGAGVASNPFLLADAAADGATSALVETLRIHETGMVFGLGTTPVPGVEHVLPNHVLDLGRWRPVRVWPRAPIAHVAREQAAGTIADVLRRTIAAVAASGDRPAMSLTAGYDTRMLLACSRSVLDQLDLFTMALPDDLGETDVRWAVRIADHLGLSHRVLPWVEPSARDLGLFLYRTGSMSGERRGRRAGPTLCQLGGGIPWIAGVLGGMVAGLELQPEDGRRRELSAPQLLRRLELPRHPELERRAEQWLEDLPDLTVEQQVSLAQLELYDAAWGGGFSHGYADCFTACYYPLGQRRVIEACLAVPGSERRASGLRRAVIAEAWPELLELPFNQPTLRMVVARRWRRFRGRSVAAARRIRRRDFRRA